MEPCKGQYCNLCLAMTATFDGLRALLSKDGYTFYNRQDLSTSADRGCLLCKWVKDSCSFRWSSWTNQELDPLIVKFHCLGPVSFDPHDKCGPLEYLEENPIHSVVITSPRHKGFLLEVYSSEGSGHNIYTCSYANFITRRRSRCFCTEYSKPTWHSERVDIQEDKIMAKGVYGGSLSLCSGRGVLSAETPD